MSDTKKKNGRYVKLVHQKEYDSIKDPFRVVRSGESRTAEYPFVRVHGNHKTNAINIVMSFEVEFRKRLNDKMNLRST